jgi:hypothetical protein
MISKNYCNTHLFGFALSMLMRAAKDAVMEIPPEPICGIKRKTLKWHRWKTQCKYKETAIQWLSMDGGVEGSSFEMIVDILIHCSDSSHKEESSDIFRRMLEQDLSIDNDANKQGSTCISTPKDVSNAIMSDIGRFIERMQACYNWDDMELNVDSLYAEEIIYDDAVNE